MMRPTEEQDVAIKEILDFLKSDNRENKTYLLKGYAGTGKTSLIRFLFENIAMNPFKIFGRVISPVISAPTNKAVKVIYQKLDKKYDAQTIHSLLAVKPFIDEHTGEEMYKPDEYAEKDIYNYNVVIIDECSMINKHLLDIIEEHILFYDIKVIFIGDSAQLPPVGESESETFSKSNSGISELMSIVRYGDTISKYAKEIREQLHVDKLQLPSPIWNPENGGIMVVPKERKINLIQNFFTSDTYANDPLSGRILTYTNKRVSYFNNLIRGWIMGLDIDPYVVGDRIIALDACLDESGNSIIMQNSVEAVVNRVTVIRHYESLKAWKLECFDEMNKHVILYTIHEDDKLEYDKKLKKYASLKEWRSFYKLKKAYHNITYCHAMTVHKSQGSTFENVFVDTGNIWFNKNIVERNQMFYVAVTRASKNVFLI